MSYLLGVTHASEKLGFVPYGTLGGAAIGGLYGAYNKRDDQSWGSALLPYMGAGALAGGGVDVGRHVLGGSAAAKSIDAPAAKSPPPAAATAPAAKPSPPDAAKITEQAKEKLVEKTAPPPTAAPAAAQALPPSAIPNSDTITEQAVTNLTPPTEAEFAAQQARNFAPVPSELTPIQHQSAPTQAPAAAPGLGRRLFNRFLGV